MGARSRSRALAWALAALLVAQSEAQNGTEASGASTAAAVDQTGLEGARPAPWPAQQLTFIPPVALVPSVGSLNAAHNGRVCSAWGDFHYKTFDGALFRFPGLCNYVFSAHCRAAYEDFNVQIRRGLAGSRPTIQRVLLKVDGLVLELAPGAVHVNGRREELPYNRAGLLVERSGSYIRVSVRLVLTFTWNGEDSALLELDPKYANQTCGLCGDFNGLPAANELFANDARLTMQQFGNLQKLDGPTEQCQDPLPTPAGNCTDEEDICRRTLLGPAFAQCNELVDAGAYVDACAQDLCRCPTCPCATFAEYSRQCAHAGGQPRNWRGPDLCLQTCPPGMQHQECGSPCADTCSNPERAQLCEDHCEDGCFCPPGTVLDDLTHTGCVPREHCPCSHGGRTFAPGASFATSCSSCICSGGLWQCQDLPCPGTCSLNGGAHVATFDQRLYDVHGDCSYVLAKKCADDSLTVLVELRKCGLTDTENCLKAVTLSLGGDLAIRIQAGGRVFMNSILTQLPVAAASVVVFQPSSHFIVVHAAPGVQLQVQLVPLMQVLLRLDAAYHGQMCGLCGNFNQNQADDFRTLGGLVEGTGAAFANTWKTQASCPDIKNHFEDPCSLSVDNENYAQHWCSQLTDPAGAFAPCHSIVNPASFHANCLFDTCNCERSEDCLCAALSAYVRACAAKGVLLSGWRDGACLKYMNNCPKSQSYAYLIDTCPPTCRGLSEADVTCRVSFVPVDGCTCPVGTFLDEAGACVPAEECPCYLHGSAVAPGEAVHDHGVVCSCVRGKLSCLGAVEQRRPGCVPPMEYLNCSDARASARGAECLRSCHTLDVDCYSTQCVSGCVCPPGLVADGSGGCIAQEDCPCVHNEATYRPGETVQVDCNTCTCRSRRWECTSQPCMGTCVAYGDGHFITFDGERYSFEGSCEYTLAQDYCGAGANGTFRIVTENVPCGTTGVTCSKAIKVFLGAYELILSEGHIKVVARGPGGDLPYRIRYMGIYLAIEARSGLVLLWDRKTTLIIRLRQHHKGKVCGLCGNFDDSAANDFTTRSRSVVGDVLEFGNSWKFSPSCPDALAPKDPCTANPYRRSWAQKQCSIINSATFAACRAQVDSTKYYEACVSDACACDAGGDCECFCTAVAAYAQACHDVGVCVAWRSPDVCPLFCDYYNPRGGCEWHYQPCGAPCLRTCRNPSGRCLVDLPGLEGCYPQCPPDKPFFSEDHMQCVAQCGCYDQEENYYDIGTGVPTVENCQSCNCTASGIQCAHSLEACRCSYEGRTFGYGEVIYNTTDGLGACLLAICRDNGAISRTAVECPGTPPTTPFTFTSTTAPPSTAGSPPTLPAASTTCVQEACEWSDWLDGSLPEPGAGGGDVETFASLRQRGFQICRTPADIQCRARQFPDVPLEELGQRVDCDRAWGLACANREQSPPLCHNYELRVLCCAHVPCSSSPAPSTSPRPPASVTALPGATTETPRSLPTQTRGTTLWSTPGSTATAALTLQTRPTSTPVPTTWAVSSPVAPGTSLCQPTCLWTQWFDEDYPKSEEAGGDIESYDKIRRAGGDLCEQPQAVECQALLFPNRTLAEIGQRVHCDASFGLVCRNDEQEGTFKMCYNYRIRVLCCSDSHCRGKATTLLPATSPGTVSQSSQPPTTAPGSTPEASPTPPVSTTATPSFSTVSTPWPTPPSSTGPGTAGCQPRCEWTEWFDVDFPTSGVKGGDMETYENIRAAGGRLCRAPERIECRAENYPEVSLDQIGQAVHCSLQEGLVCRNEEQRGRFNMCFNYNVRVLCCDDYGHCGTTAATTAPPTATSALPTATTAPPTATSVPPTATSAPPTATSAPSTATTSPPMTTSALPTATTTPSTATTVLPTATSAPPMATTTLPTAASTSPTVTTALSTATTALSTQATDTLNSSGAPGPSTLTVTQRHPTPPSTTKGVSSPNTETSPLSPSTTEKLSVSSASAPPGSHTQLLPTSPQPTTGTPTMTPQLALSTVPPTSSLAISPMTTAPGSGGTKPTFGTTSFSSPLKPSTVPATLATSPATGHPASPSTPSSGTPWIWETTTRTSAHTPMPPSRAGTSSAPPTGWATPSAPTPGTTTSALGTTPGLSSAPPTATSPPSRTSTSSLLTSSLSPPPGLPSAASTACQPLCAWTDWLDESYPLPGSSGGDFETYANLRAAGQAICRRPLDLECRAELWPHTPLQQLGQVVRCSLDEGLVCRNRDQAGAFKMCINYHIRVFCCSYSHCPPTPATTTVSPTGTSPEWSTTLATGTTALRTPTHSPSAPATGPTTVPSGCRPACHWTDWLDSDRPQPGRYGGDIETYYNIADAGGQLCAEPAAIECAATLFPGVPVAQLGQVVQCDVDYGLICRNQWQRQGQTCHNYHVRVLCCDDYSHCMATATTTVSTPTRPQSSEVQRPLTTATTQTHATSPGTTEGGSTPTTQAHTTSPGAMEGSIPTTQTHATSPGATEGGATPTTQTHATSPGATEGSIPTTQTHATSPGATEGGATPTTQTHAMSPGTTEWGSTPTTQTHATSPGATEGSIPTTQAHATSPGTTEGGSIPPTQTHAPSPGTTEGSTPTTQTHATSPGTTEGSIPTTQTHATSPGTTEGGSIPPTQTHAASPGTTEGSIPTTQTHATSPGATEGGSTPTMQTHAMSPGPTESVSTSSTSTHPSSHTQLLHTSPQSTPGTPTTTGQSALSTTLPAPSLTTSLMITTHGSGSTRPTLRTMPSSRPTKPGTVPTTSVTSPVTSCEPRCTWTGWFDEDYPTYEPGSGDFETYAVLRSAGHIFCASPVDIQCRSEEEPDKSLADLGQVVHCNVSFGLVCQNLDQPRFFRYCHNYQVRVLCCDDYSHCGATASPTPSMTTTTQPWTLEFSSSTTATTETQPMSTRTTKGVTIPHTSPLPTPATSSTTALPPPSVPPTSSLATSPITTAPGSGGTKPTFGTTLLSSPPKPSTVTTTSAIVPATGCEPRCVWSDWFDENYPIPGPDGGDFETYTVLRSAGHVFCASPVDIQCRSEKEPDQSLADLGQVVHCNLSFGLVCRNQEQPRPFKYCHNYHVRVLCCDDYSHCGATAPSTPATTQSWTTWFSWPSTTATTEARTPPRTTKGVTVPHTSPQPTPVTSSITMSPLPSTSSLATSPIITYPPSGGTQPISGTTLSSTAPKSGTIPTITVTSSATGCEPRCMWSDWFDENYPIPGPDGGDFETYAVLRSAGHVFCASPVDIQCRSEKEPDQSLADLGQVVHCNLSFGLVCQNQEQPGPFKYCHNYHVRVLCCDDYSHCVSPPRTPVSTVWPPSLPASQSPHTRTVTPTHRPSFSMSPSFPSPFTTPQPTSLPSSAFSSTPCFCRAFGKLFSPGDIVYNQTDRAGCQFYATCNEHCDVDRFQGPCPTTASHVSSATPSSATAASPSPPPGCSNIMPPRKVNESWTLENCTVARCEGGDRITLLEPKPVANVTCVNEHLPVRVWNSSEPCDYRYECECSCSIWGNSHYSTFDGTSYAFADNCTSVLMREIRPRHGNLSLLLSNRYCAAAAGSAHCPRALRIYYKAMEVVLTTTHTGGTRESLVLFDRERVYPGFSKDGVSVSMPTATTMAVAMPAIGVHVAFDGHIFQARLAYSQFSHNTEGQCGTCTNSRTDDCRLPDGTMAPTCQSMAMAWLVPESSQEGCSAPTGPPPTASPEPPVPTSPASTACTPAPLCQLLLSPVFAECHALVPPGQFLSACVSDSCGDSASRAPCQSLEAYAALCRARGVCSAWRNATGGLCDLSCPATKVYKPCGPMQPETCDFRTQGPVLGGLAEGCFCPDDTILFNSYTDVCVPECPCVGPDGFPKLPGERWVSDCQACVCDARMVTVRCEPVRCSQDPAPECGGPGFVSITRPHADSPCCAETLCVCNVTTCPQAPPECGPGQELTSTLEEGACCPTFGCRPKLCSYNGTVYGVGATFPSAVPCHTCACLPAVSPDAQHPRVRCKKDVCTTTCPEGSEYTPAPGRCCGECVQTSCLAPDGGRVQPHDTWVDSHGDNCTQYRCEVADGIPVLLPHPTPCPDVTGCRGILRKTGCCFSCEEADGCQVRVSTAVLRHRDCATAAAVNVTYCEGPCPGESRYTLEAQAMQRRCTCCQETRVHVEAVTLRCPNGAEIQHTYTQVDACACTASCIPAPTALADALQHPV
ncbi:mucin-5B isoform X2 [Dasypus novemcinctus]|uniref:mucin-5B isoform X2 n=1 Tax=Dasypus novemcinctus TaxID=9361 RepID=UPI0039C9F415